MSEELTLHDLPVEGEIPRELDGRYVRIGPNPAAPDPRTYHFFVGDGMLHGLRIRDGQALWYRNRWIRSDGGRKGARLSGRPGPAAPRVRHGQHSVLDHAGSGWALVEAGSTPVRFNEELEDQSYDDFAGTLPGSFTAHPRCDPRTGELHALCYEANDLKRLRYNVVDKGGRVRRSVVIPVEHGPLIHDCAITQRYVVILDLPLTLSMRCRPVRPRLSVSLERQPPGRGSGFCRVRVRPKTFAGYRSIRVSCSTTPTPTISPTAGWCSMSSPMSACSQTTISDQTNSRVGWNAGRSIRAAGTVSVSHPRRHGAGASGDRRPTSRTSLPVRPTRSAFLPR